MGEVITFGGALPTGGHERTTHAAVARELAALLGYRFAGEEPGVDDARTPDSPAAVPPLPDASASRPQARAPEPAAPAAAKARAAAPHPLRVRRYVVPSDTLLHQDAAALGVRDPADLFGGVVPFPFVGTKSITHPLVPGAAAVPDGWQAEFAAAVHDDVLAGHAAFTRRDAGEALRRLLPRGPVRVKRATGIGGRGQWLVRNEAEARHVLGALDDAELAQVGCVIEEQLEDVRTASVGRVDVAGMFITYCGQQRLTRNHAGEEVYGGSDLVVARGDFAALLQLALDDDIRRAIEQARRYDQAAHRAFPSFFASRRNYDIAQGRDGSGAMRSGVLEQSWRIGGASGAEVVALRAFAADPTLTAVRARTVEVYGEAEPPDGALVLYHGVDSRIGPLLKYATVEAHAHP